jgi:hypothetical protein
MSKILLRVKDLKTQMENEVEVSNFPFTIGREKTNSLQLLDSNCSRTHAEIQLRGEEFWYQDLQSTNGSFFGKAPGKNSSTRVAEVRLRTGAVVRIGDFLLEAVLPGEDNEVTSIWAGPPKENLPVSVLPVSAPSPFHFTSENLPETLTEETYPANVWDRAELIASDPRAIPVLLFFGPVAVFLYSHDSPYNLVIQSFINALGSAIVASLLAFVSWGACKLLKRKTPYRKLWIVYLVYCLAGWAPIFLRDRLAQLNPEGSHASVAWQTAILATFLFVLILNCKWIFAMKQKSLTVLGIISLVLTVSFFGSEWHGMKPRWKTSLTRPKMMAVPNRLPAGSYVETNQFIQELDESLILLSQPKKD